MHVRYRGPAGGCFVLLCIGMYFQENYTVNPVANAKGDRPSPYKGGLFRVQIKLSENYPIEPPEVRGCERRARWTSGMRRWLVQRVHTVIHLVCAVACPAQVAFNTRVWHPQIAPDSGKPCIDFLKEQWKLTTMLANFYN